ncbi:hypothetical protein [Natronoglomus mannanivorans]|uniref:Uncharacterized protein n=1 Tax=Natronoglomus mannanivorans TaxID=2979990 RepID=A0AAP3E2L2_9EURY|nr:hypothetical protein [Halobacteria archaeon AArc-xg1-1]
MTSEDESDEKPLDDLPLSLDAILGVSASYRRRALLKYLWDQPDNVGSFEEAIQHTIAELGQ